MRIDLNSIDRDQFSVKEFDFHGEILFLVNPKNTFEVDWDKNNLIFRSSIWNKEGELCSAGFKKFTNWLEKPDLFPVPQNLVNCDLIEKCDGSLLVLSNYKGNEIIRTRGSWDAAQKENGYEIVLLKEQYPRVFNNTNLKSGKISLLLEWVSPTNKIVCNYEKPDIYLIGAINHEDYSLISQGTLDELAEIYRIKRPARYNFGSISEMLAAIKAIKEKEGLCLYALDGNIFKIKSDWYCKIHSFKSHITLNSIIDLFCDWNRPDKDVFTLKLAKETDYECVKVAEPLIQKVCSVWREVLILEKNLEEFVVPLRGLPRKEAAEIIKKSEFSAICFQLLNGKIDKRAYKELLLKHVK